MPVVESRANDCCPAGMGILFSVPFGLFLGLIIWAVFYFPLTFIFGVQFTADGSYVLLAVVFPFAYAYVLTRWIRDNGLLRQPDAPQCTQGAPLVRLFLSIS